MHFPQGIDYLSNELHLIIWNGYPLKSLPTSFQSEDLIGLVMHCSHIEQLWKGIKVRFTLITGVCIFSFNLKLILFFAESFIVRISFCHRILKI